MFIYLLLTKFQPLETSLQNLQDVSFASNYPDQDYYILSYLEADVLGSQKGPRPNQA